MLGRDERDPLFLQFKEAEASVLEPFLGKSTFSNHGQRVVEGQRLTQAASDIMLGWIRVTDLDGVSRDFYMRQLWDGKGSAIVETMNPQAMTMYAELCGHALAKAHARSGDAIAIASYLGAGDSFDRALASFAEAYADQNERDYRRPARGRGVRSRRGQVRPLRSKRRTKGSAMAGSTSETPVLDLLAGMTADSVAASSLDAQTLMLVRIAALAAVDAPPVSYALNLEAASEVGIGADDVRGVLAAIAPIVGTARVASATVSIVEALAIEMEIAELEEEDQE